MDLNERIQSLKNERSEILNNLEANVDSENFDTDMEKVDSLQAQIDKYTKLQNEQNKNVMNVFNDSKDGQEAVQAFDFGRMLQNAASGRAQEGAEAEIIAETKKGFINNGLNVSGLALPMQLFNAHSAGAANNGEALLETVKGDFIESLKKRLVLGQLGVQVLNDLNGTIEMGASTAPASPSVKTETEAAEEYTMNLVNRTLAPIRGAVKGIYSKQLMHQTSYNIRQILEDELIAGMVGRAEEHAISEVVTNAGSTVAIGTNGGALTFAKAIELLNALDDANSNGTNNAFVTRASVRQQAQQIALDSGSGRFLWEHTTPRQFLGETAVVTNHVDGTLSKGTGTNLTSLIYGDFNFLTIGFWGGVDLIVDPYSLADNGQIKLVLNFFHDSVVRQPGNFAVIKDIDPSA